MAVLRGVLAAVLLAAAAGPAKAAELSNLDSGLPNTLDDALAVAPGRVELQGAARYDLLRAGRDAVRLLPRVQVGIADGLQATIGVPYVIGSGRRSDPSDPIAGLLYNLNRERDWLPAFAVSADLGTPVGQEGRSAETGLTVIATKTLTPSVDRRVHLNVAWLRSLDPDEEERRDRYRVVVGYSQLVAPDVVVVADYLRESQERPARGSGQHRGSRAALPVQRAGNARRRRGLRPGFAALPRHLQRAGRLRRAVAAPLGGSRAATKPAAPSRILDTAGSPANSRRVFR